MSPFLILILGMNNTTGQFNKYIQVQKLNQIYIGQLMRVEQIAERYQINNQLKAQSTKSHQSTTEDNGTLSMKSIINNVPKFDPNEDKF